MRITLLLALLAATPAGAAFADGLPHGRDPGYGARHERPVYAPRRFGHAPRRRVHRSYAPAYEPTGPYLAEYREEYIARGLIYNTPPDPSWTSGVVVRALN